MDSTTYIEKRILTLSAWAHWKQRECLISDDDRELAKDVAYVCRIANAASRLTNLDRKHSCDADLIRILEEEESL
jgi:hypothetical protein